MATPAQIEANRANALRSTGPRTAEGKEASRRNALKHGLAAERLVLPDEETDAVAARVAAWTESWGPREESEARLVEEMALSSVRIERCQAHETALRVRSAARASLCWEVDREAEAEELGGRLARRPGLVSRQLRRSKQGCAWLIARWEGLRLALDANGGWSEAQKRLALDLLGTPKEFRDVASPIDGDRRALVHAELARLEVLCSQGLEKIDGLERKAAEVGLGRDIEKAVNLSRRYEAACVRRFEQAHDQLMKGRRTAAPRASKAPALAHPSPMARLSEKLTTRADVPPPAASPAPPAPLPIESITPTRDLSGENRRARRARLAKALRRA